MNATQVRFEPRFGDRYPSQQMVDEEREEQLLIAYREHLLRELLEVERLLKTHAREGILCG